MSYVLILFLCLYAVTISDCFHVHHHRQSLLRPHLYFNSVLYARKFTNREVDLVISKTGCRLDEAFAALEDVDGQVVDAMLLIQEMMKDRVEEIYRDSDGVGLRVDMDEIGDDMCGASETCIYVLKCRNNCYYVGSTCNLEERLRRHSLGDACAWTNKNPVLSLETYYNFPEGTSKEDIMLLEDTETRSRMFKHGIDEVRGGSYSMVELPEYQMQTLIKEQRHARGECYKCGSPEHFASDCPIPQTGSSGRNKEKKDAERDEWDNTVKTRLSDLEKWRAALVPRLQDIHQSLNETILNTTALATDSASWCSSWDDEMAPTLNNTLVSIWSDQRDLMHAVLQQQMDFENNITAVLFSLDVLREEAANLTDTANVRVSQLEEWRTALVPGLRRLNDEFSTIRRESGTIMEDVKTQLALAAVESRQEQRILKEEVNRLRGEMEKRDDMLKELVEESRKKGSKRRKVGNLLKRLWTNERQGRHPE